MDSRPPPGPPPTYAFVTRVYRRNLRPVVLGFAFMGALWSLFSGIGFFRNVPIYNSNNAHKLGTFSVIIGILYMVVFGIEAFGMFAAFTQKLFFVRMYAYLAAVVTLLVVAVGLLQVVIHFTLKQEIIDVCTNFNEGDTVFYGSIFGPVRSSTLSPADAHDWCTNSWDRGSWSNILSFLIISVLAAFFTVLAFSYLRQILDPSHPSNVFREPNNLRMGNFPSHYNPPYNPANVPYGGPGYYPAYPAPAGPPPNHNEAFVPPYDNNDSKPPGYVRGDDYKGQFAEQQKGGGYSWNETDADGPSERDVTTGRPNPFH